MRTKDCGDNQNHRRVDAGKASRKRLRLLSPSAFTMPHWDKYLETGEARAENAGHHVTHPLRRDQKLPPSDVCLVAA